MAAVVARRIFVADKIQFSKCYAALAPLSVRSYSNGKETSAPKKSGSNNEGYKVPEYYEHDKWTYVDFEVHMKQARLPQPSNETPLKK